MRILHWCECFHPRIGGVETFVRALAGAQAAQGHAVQILTEAMDACPATETIDGVAVARLPLEQPLLERDMMSILQRVADCRALIENFAPDLIHLHSAQSGAFYFLRTLARTPVPAVFTTHHGVVDDIPPERTLFAQIFDHVQVVACISGFMHAYTRERHPRHADRIRLISNALPAAPLPRVPAPHAGLSLFAAGRLVPDKGFASLLRALALLEPEGPAVALRLAGNGPEDAALRALAEELELGTRIRFLGPIAAAQMPREIDAANLVIVPSEWDEPFGLIALEAMQRGRAVLATRSGALPDMVEDGVSGRLVDRKDPAALAAALEDYRRHPGDLVPQGEAAHTRSTSLFSWERCVAAYDAAYAHAAATA